MGIVGTNSTVKIPVEDNTKIAERLIEMLTEEGNLIIPHVSNSLVCEDCEKPIDELDAWCKHCGEVIG